MPDIQVGDLVRFKWKQINTSRQGIWLVERIELNPKKGWTKEMKIVTLIKGSERRRAYSEVLMKISSSRQQEKL